MSTTKEKYAEQIVPILHRSNSTYFARYFRKQCLFFRWRPHIVCSHTLLLDTLEITPWKVTREVTSVLIFLIFFTESSRLSSSSSLLYYLFVSIFILYRTHLLRYRWVYSWITSYHQSSQPSKLFRLVFTVPIKQDSSISSRCFINWSFSVHSLSIFPSFLRFQFQSVRPYICSTWLTLSSGQRLFLFFFHAANRQVTSII